jgi:hypothetical protein
MRIASKPSRRNSENPYHDDDDFKSLDAAILGKQEKAILKQVRVAETRTFFADTWDAQLLIEGGAHWPKLQEAFSKFVASRQDLAWLAPISVSFLPK